jgi:hypothetical protein
MSYKPHQCVGWYIGYFPNLCGGAWGSILAGQWAPQLDPLRLRLDVGAALLLRYRTIRAIDEATSPRTSDYIMLAESLPRPNSGRGMIFLGLCVLPFHQPLWTTGLRVSCGSPWRPQPDIRSTAIKAPGIVVSIACFKRKTLLITACYIPTCPSCLDSLHCSTPFSQGSPSCLSSFRLSHLFPTPLPSKTSRISSTIMSSPTKARGRHKTSSCATDFHMVALDLRPTSSHTGLLHGYALASVRYTQRNPSHTAGSTCFYPSGPSSSPFRSLSSQSSGASEGGSSSSSRYGRCPCR